MKRESVPSYKQVMRELYGDIRHPDFDRAKGTSPAEHKAMVRLSFRRMKRDKSGRFSK